MNKKGISLLETIIYVSILAVMVAVVINTVVITTTAFGKSRIKRNIASQGGAAFERILREVRLADDIDEAGSVFVTHPGHLRLNTVVSPSDNTPTTREFYLSDSTLTIQAGGGTAISLTSGLDITRLVFYEISVSTTSQALRIEMTLEDGEGRFETSQNFYGTAVLRRSY